MAYYITVSTYELKANLSKYLRALHRGDCDALVIKRYGRECAFIHSFRHNKPAVAPQTKEDIAMRWRAQWRDTGVISRRGPD